MGKNYRNEWKYCCPDYYLTQLISRLENFLEPDCNASDDYYRVRTLYFDDINSSCAMSVNAGASKRFKYRLRYYDDNISTLHFERKEKLFGRCRKFISSVSTVECNLLCNGDVWPVFWGNDNDYLKKFCVDIISKSFSPKIITDYERKAYVDENLNIRITIDKNIFVSKDIENFLDGVYDLMPIQNTNWHILEIKFDEILPKYIMDIINMRCLNQTSFSKYYIGRQKLMRV